MRGAVSKSVIWPAPANNAQVLTAGIYTLTGKVPGTEFQPKATVKVKASAKKPALPTRQLDTFPLGSVTLLQDDRQQDTPFMKNRDKFVRVLAKTNPDNFLYMFRDAFGQPQPPTSAFPARKSMRPASSVMPKSQALELLAVLSTPCSEFGSGCGPYSDQWDSCV